MPGVVQDDGGVRMVPKEDWYKVCEEFLSEYSDRWARLQEGEDQHIGAQLHRNFEQLLNLIVGSHFRQVEEGFYKIQRPPKNRTNPTLTKILFVSTLPI